MHVNIMFQIQLRDKNESLLHRVESLQGQYGNLASTKTDLSTQLLMTEEEKLKVCTITEHLGFSMSRKNTLFTKYVWEPFWAF